MPEIAPLRDYLAMLMPGSVQNPGQLSSILAECWDSLAGSRAGGMDGDKLVGRMAGVVWEPPALTFSIERHGATVNGSTRAELQHWTVNVDHGVADLTGSGVRQLQPMQPKLDVRPLAEAVAQLIVNQQDDERLKWNKSGSVQVAIGRILPAGSAAKETLAGRRKRFWAALDQVVARAGWRRLGSGHYAPAIG